MIAFHGDVEIKKEILSRLKAHAEADEIIQGTGWEKGKGCDIGCTFNNYDHSLYPKIIGLPEEFGFLCDKIFEGLSNEEAKKFPIDRFELLIPGVDYSDICRLWKIKNLEYLISVQEKNSYPDNQIVVSAIKQVIDCLKNKKTKKDFESAAESAAGSAAWSARSAAWSARSAAESAESAAGSAAESAYYIMARDWIYEAIKEINKGRK